MTREDGAAYGGTDDWRLRAACRPLDSALFFPERAGGRNTAIARAKAVCHDCPVRESCLRAAMDGREKTGIWGGLTPQERAHLRRRRQRVQETAGRHGTPNRPERGPIGGAGAPTREQIRRAVAAGWLRLETVPESAVRKGAPG